MDQRIVAPTTDDSRWDASFEHIVRDNVPLLDEDEPLLAATALADFGMDSLNVLGLMVAVESEYAITIPEDQLVLDSFATPGALWSIVKRLRGAETSGAENNG